MFSLWKEIKKAITLIRCLPKTIYFNFHYLPLKDAIHLPILIAYNLQLLQMKGTVSVHQCKTASVQIGFSGSGIITSRGEGWWNSTGNIHFYGKVRISGNPKLFMTGNVTFKNNFNAGYNFLLTAHHTVHFEEDLLISWNVSIMDNDGHKIKNLNGDIINSPTPIFIGSHSWIGSHSTVLKGCHIPENTIIGSHSLITKSFSECNTIIAGSPAKQLKENVSWKE